MLLRPRFWRWLHCLTHLHRAVTFRVSNLPIFIGCECGYTTFGNKETAEAVMAFIQLGRECAQADLAPRADAQKEG